MHRYRIQHISTAKGRGMIAVIKRIKPGMLIVEEAALLSIPVTTPWAQWTDQAQMAWFLNESAGGTTHIRDAVNRLSTEKQQQFGVLHTSSNANTDVGRVERNCYSMENGENGTTITVFNDISLINHSCRPNAVFSLESNLPRAKLYAIATIPRDEEIVIEYCATDHLFLSAQGRQTDSPTGIYSFRCDCQSCNADQAESDRNRAEPLAQSRQLGWN